MANDLEATNMRPFRKRTSKQIAAIVILVFMGMVLSFVEFPIFPPAQWLKYDPSGIVTLLATLIFGPWTGCVVAVLAWVPHLVTDPIGAFMNIVAACSVAIVLGAVYWHKPSFASAIKGSILGIICSVAISIILNFVVTPMYLPATYEDVVAMVVPYLLPFNIMKSTLNCAVALLAYRKLDSLLQEGAKQGEQFGTTR